MDTQLKKGFLELCLLQQLSRRDYYGYDLIQSMKQLFPDVSDSSFYIILRRVHKEGLSEVYFGETSKGPQRKYYRLTDKGRDQLREATADWQRLLAISEALSLHEKDPTED